MLREHTRSKRYTNSFYANEKPTSLKAKETNEETKKQLKKSNRKTTRIRNATHNASEMGRKKK